MKRAQIATEFTAMIAFAILLLVGYLYVALFIYTQSASEEEYTALYTVGKQFQSEVLAATQAHDSYTRTFSVPSVVVGKTYEIISSSGFISLHTQKQATSIKTPPFFGKPTPGTNTIYKNESGVYFT